MRQTFACAVLVVLGLVIAVFLGLPYLMSWQLSESHQQTWEVMDRSEFPCPENSEVTTRGWSKAGYMRYCEPKKSGPWEAWSEGRLQVKGEYLNGKEHGEWQWFGPDGSVAKTLHYQYGKPVSERVEE